MNLQFNQINSAVEIICIILSLILLSQQVLIKRYRKNNTWFVLVLTSNILMLMGDLAEWALGGNPSTAAFILLNIFSVYLYYAVSALLLLSAYYWIYNLAKERQDYSSRLNIPCGIAAVGQLLMVITIPLHNAVSINSEHYYTRGNNFFLLMLFIYVLYIICVALLITLRKAFTKREFVTLVLFLLTPLIGDIIQLADSRLCVQDVLLSLVLVYVCAFIQYRRDVEYEHNQKELMSRENDRLQKLQLFQKTLTEQLIDALCGAVEAKDHYTRGHSFRVAQYAREIMRRMGGDQDAQQETYYIGILHDVGKISIDDSYINKKGRLTEEEYLQMKLHTVEGYQILKDITVIPDLASGARWHHERWDGKGYPNGLVAEDIPLIARIISVADAYDAMTSTRSYHDTYTQEYVRSEIAKGMGTQFDPEIARIMLKMIDEDTEYTMREHDLRRVGRVLIIDDDPEIHNIIMSSMKEDICLFSSAFDYEQALLMMVEKPFDVCLIDMQMPKMNAFALMNWIQNESKGTKVLFFNGERNPETIRNAEKMGVIDYITEPMNQAMLVERVRSCLLKLH